MQTSANDSSVFSSANVYIPGCSGPLYTEQIALGDFIIVNFFLIVSIEHGFEIAAKYGLDNKNLSTERFPYVTKMSNALAKMFHQGKSTEMLVLKFSILHHPEDVGR